MRDATPYAVRRWVVLAGAVLAQAAASVAINGPAFLIPAWQDERGLSLAAAGTLATMPIAGVMLTLYAWGWLVDRWGERRVLTLGLGATSLAGVGAATVESYAALAAALVLVGAAAASTASASGRIVVGWFPAHRRGLAMGIRQMAQPLGVAVAAVSIAATAARTDPATAAWIPVAVTAVSLVVVAVLVVDPERPAATPDLTANPYRADRFLARIHGVSVLLVVPQILVWTFALTWLVTERGWSAASAGTLVAVTHLLGAAGRLAVGQLSDQVASRVRPLRWVALLAAASMLALGALEPTDVAVVVLVVASVVTVADNGLAFTSVAERAGSYWSGRALGVQNTGQYVAGAAVGPLGGLAITQVGYAATFAGVAVLPLLAVALVPRRDPAATWRTETTDSPEVTPR